MRIINLIAICLFMASFKAAAQDSYSDPVSGITFISSSFIVNHKESKCVKIKGFNDTDPGLSIGGNLYIVKDCKVSYIDNQPIKKLSDVIDYLKTNPKGKKSIVLHLPGSGMAYTIYGAPAGKEYPYINFPNPAGSIVTPEGTCLWGDCSFGRGALQDAAGNVFIGEFLNGKLSGEIVIKAMSGNKYSATSDKGIITYMKSVTGNPPAIFYFKNGVIEKINFGKNYYPTRSYSFAELITVPADKLVASFASDDNLTQFTGVKPVSEKLKIPVWNESCAATYTNRYLNGAVTGTDSIIFYINNQKSYALTGEKLVVNKGAISGQKVRMVDLIKTTNKPQQVMYADAMRNDTLTGAVQLSTNPFFYGWNEGLLNYTADNKGLVTGKFNYSFKQTGKAEYTSLGQDWKEPHTFDEMVDALRWQISSQGDENAKLPLAGRKDNTAMVALLNAALNQIEAGIDKKAIHVKGLMSSGEGYGSRSGGANLDYGESMLVVVFAPANAVIVIKGLYGDACSTQDVVVKEAGFKSVQCAQTNNDHIVKFYSYTVEVFGQDVPAAYFVSIIKRDQ